MSAVETKVTPAKPYAEVTLRTEDELSDLIDGLRAAGKQSRRSGGRYLASVEDVTGKIVIYTWLPATAAK